MQQTQWLVAIDIACVEEILCYNNFLPALLLSVTHSSIHTNYYTYV